MLSIYHFLTRSVVVFALFSCAVLAQSDSFDEAFERADSIKTAEPATFTQILHDLNTSVETLTPVQMLKLKYLNAFSLSFSGKLSEGISLYKEIVDSNVDDNIAIKSAMSIVNNSAYVEDWHNGLHYANYLLDNVPSIQDNILLSQIYFAIASLFNNLGQHEKALTYSQTILRIADTPRDACLGYMVNIEALLKLGLLNDNIDKTQLGIQQCEIANELLASYVIQNYLAEHLTNTNRATEAIALLNSSIESVLSTRYPLIIAGYYSALASAYLQNGNFFKAEDYALRLVNLNQLPEYKPSVVSALKTLYEVELTRQNYKSALDYYTRYSEANKRYLDKERSKELVVQQANLETLEKNNQIALLDKQNALLRTQTELARQQAQNNRLALALASSLLVILLFWLYRSRRVQNKLKKMAETDELTGISNRHYFNERATMFIKQAEMQQQPICFILFDLDHFKKINDSFGHQVGDWALRESVLEAQSVCRSIDVIGRMGGEEFSILLPGCNIDEGLRIAEICRRKIERISSVPTSHNFNLSASFGVSDNVSCGYDLDRLFAGADSALYYSKEHGRNKVYQFDQQQFSMGT